MKKKVSMQQTTGGGGAIENADDPNKNNPEGSSDLHGNENASQIRQRIKITSEHINMIR